MKERLIKLINEYPCMSTAEDRFMESIAEDLADFLLANGVIVPPCKVGDTVYLIEDWGYKQEIQEEQIGCIVIKGTNDFSKEFWEDVHGGVFGNFVNIDKTVFLSREEAEKALADRSEGK